MVWESIIQAIMTEPPAVMIWEVAMPFSCALGSIALHVFAMQMIVVAA